jgi:hypothetical protein
MREVKRKTDAFDLLADAAVDPTDEKIRAALADSRIADRLGTLSLTDFRLLAGLVTRFITLSQPPTEAQSKITGHFAESLTPEDAAMLRDVLGKARTKEPCQT